MNDNFDPYLQWLGIRDPQRPPNHYRLLGLEVFEADRAVIATAADRQMAHIRSFQSGKYGALSQQVLNELAGARLCLLKPETKAAYDQQLKRSTPPPTIAHPARQSSAAPAAPPQSQPSDATQSKWRDDADAAKHAEFSNRPTSQELDFLQPIRAVGKAATKSTLSRPKSKNALAMTLGVIAVGIVGCGLLLWQINRQSADVTTKDSLAQGSIEDARSTAATSQSTTEGKSVAPKSVAPSSDIPKQSGPPRAGNDQGREPNQASQAAKIETRPNPTPATARASLTEPALEDPTAAKTAAQMVGGLTVAQIEAPEPQPVDAGKLPTAETTKAVKPQPLDDRLPVPDKAAQAASLKLIHDLFKAEYASRKQDDRVAFAKKLLQQGGESNDDVVTQYVLWREAADIAANAGEASTALQAFESVAKKFAVKSADEKIVLLTDLARPSLRSTDLYRTWFSSVAELIDTSVASDEYEPAKRGIALGASVARRLQDPVRIGQFTARTREIEQLKKEFEKVKGSAKTLEESPNDPEANQAVGAYYAFYKGDFNRGLPLLAKGNDPVVKDLATKNLDSSEAPKDQAAMGDGWWALSETRKDSSRFVIRTHAADYYRQAVLKLTGLPKSAVESRLKEFEKELFAREQIPPSLMLSLLTNTSWTITLRNSPAPSDEPQIQFVPNGTWVGNRWHVNWELRGNVVHCFGGTNPKVTGQIKLISADTFTWDVLDRDQVIKAMLGTAIRK